MFTPTSFTLPKTSKKLNCNSNFVTLSQYINLYIKQNGIDNFIVEKANEAHDEPWDHVAGF